MALLKELRSCYTRLKDEEMLGLTTKLRNLQCRE